MDNGLAKRAVPGAVASQVVIHALAVACGLAWRASGDDRVEASVEGLVVFDRRRGRQGLKRRDGAAGVRTGRRISPPRRYSGKSESRTSRTDRASRDRRQAQKV